MRITNITVNTKIKKPIYNDYRIKNKNYAKTNYNGNNKSNLQKNYIKT